MNKNKTHAGPMLMGSGPYKPSPRVLLVATENMDCSLLVVSHNLIHFDETSGRRRGLLFVLFAGGGGKGQCLFLSAQCSCDLALFVSVADLEHLGPLHLDSFPWPNRGLPKLDALTMAVISIRTAGKHLGSGLVHWTCA